MRYYSLNPSTYATWINENDLVVTATGIGAMTISSGGKEFAEILSIFTTPHTYDGAYAALNSNIYMSKHQFNEFFETMVANNLLKEFVEADETLVLDEYHREKYKRQISSFQSLPGVEKTDAEHMQARICNSCVCIVGVGGTGSHLALAMASIGVEHLIIVDFDLIELSNTSRQVLYDEHDVGRLKVEVASAKLKRYNSKARIDTFNVHILSREDLSFLKNYQNIDLIILCADTPRGIIQYIVDDVAQELRIPWFCYGPFKHSQILVGPLFVPNKTKSYREIFPYGGSRDSAPIKMVNNSFVASICDPYNGFASQFAAIEALKFLSGTKETSLLNRRYYIDTDNWKVETVDYD